MNPCLSLPANGLSLITLSHPQGASERSLIPVRMPLAGFTYHRKQTKCVTILRKLDLGIHSYYMECLWIAYCWGGNWMGI